MLFTVRSLPLLLALALAPSILAAPGDLDLAFTPNVGGEVEGTVVQPDGKILVAVQFMNGAELKAGVAAGEAAVKALSGELEVRARFSDADCPPLGAGLKHPGTNCRRRVGARIN